MTKKEKYYVFVALQTILNGMKWRPLMDEPNAEEINKRIDNVIGYLEELKGKIHE